MKTICTDCGHVYDADTGDPSRRIPPGTEFAELPLDWSCPECLAGTDHFEVIDENVTGQQEVVSIRISDIPELLKLYAMWRGSASNFLGIRSISEW